MQPSPFPVSLVGIKGRGAAARTPHRFESDRREAFDDGWGDECFGGGSGGPPAPSTEVRFETAASALAYNDSPDLGFDRSLNPYRGCEHGCIYCFARPTHAYLGLSPGLDFETRLIAKQGLAEQLRRELARPGYRPAPVAIGTATDAYQPVERRLRLTRAVLQVLHEARHPLAIVTKSAGIERDLDLLADMGRQRLAAVHVSLCTLDADLARRLEPRAAAPARRLRTIAALAAAGVPVGVSVAPQIPFVNDDMERVLQAACEAGATRAFYTVVRLPWEVAPLLRDWLRRHMPGQADRVMARIREMRGGRDNDPRFGSRMTGQGVWADLLAQRFAIACRRLGLNRARLALDCSQFRPPSPPGQGVLF